ncbi:MAG: hypothetical protein HFH13_10715 [Dorea sp.]|nr:hypothetical protein [Dorea sp.]
MNIRPTCYIAYCHKDISVEQMKAIVKWMRELCDEKIDFLFDQYVKYSESFDDFEEGIFSSDSIIIFLTPQYKKRCLEEGNTGVSKEYRKILAVRDANKKLQQKEISLYLKNRKIIHTILFKGDKANSVTYEFLDNHYLDMSSMTKFTEDGTTHKLALSDNFKSQFGRQLKEILDDIITAGVQKTEEYDSDYQKTLNELFINTKGEHVKLPEELFIETEAYNAIINQNKYLIIGRKGSGKTTVKNTVSRGTKLKYKGIISIIADQFSVDETYELLFKNKKVKSDIETNLSKIDSYKIIWNAFIYIYCMFIVYKEYLINNLSSIEQRRHITTLERVIINIFKDKARINKIRDEEVTKTIYFYVLSNLELYIDFLVQKGRNSLKYLATDVKSYYTPDEYLKYLIGEAAFDDFFYIIKFCNRKIFITLDGFDLRFELFKESTIRIDDVEERKRRIEFESIWLMIFIETLIELKADSRMKDIIDLCLTLPVDRIEAIKNNNRDFYKYRAYTVSLSWSNKDLQELIFYRLRYLNKLNDPKLIKKYTDLESVMNKFYHNVPSSIQMERNGYLNIPLFLYILRKSFWRPRDIIRYYGCILTMSQNQKNLSNISIKRAIKDESFRIIQDEFFGEFKNLYSNLKEIVHLFNTKKQILSYDEIYDILKDKDLIIEGDIREKNVDNKIKILYTIGFFGINPPEEFINEQYLFDEYAFVFTEGTSLLRVLRYELKNQCKYIIHPIFTEYLFLKVDYNKLVCNYTQDYLDNIQCGGIDYVMFED